MSYRFDGKQKTLADGVYPTVGLASARKWRDEVKQQLSVGQDPGQIQKAANAKKRQARADTFEVNAREWLSSIRPQWSDRYAALVLSRFENDVFPVIGKFPIAEVDPLQLRAMLKRVEDRGAVEFAHRIRAHCGCVFRFAIANSRTAVDPSAQIAGAQPKPKPVVHRARVKASDMPDFFLRSAKDDGAELTKLALR